MSVCVLSSFDVQDIPSVCRCHSCYYFNTRNDKIYSHTHPAQHSTTRRKIGQRTEKSTEFSISCNGKLPAAIHSRLWLHISSFIVVYVVFTNIRLWKVKKIAHRRLCHDELLCFFFVVYFFFRFFCLAESTCTSCTTHRTIAESKIIRLFSRRERENLWRNRSRRKLPCGTNDMRDNDWTDALLCLTLFKQRENKNCSSQTLPVVEIWTVFFFCSTHFLRDANDAISPMIMISFMLS